jgi:NAD(P)-dependent dehydrogenase (short-subunit alcohol dehydrogenase family)
MRNVLWQRSKPTEGALLRSGFDGIDTARLQRVFATNVFGMFACAREAVRRMSIRRGGAGGAIVNVSSAAARLGSTGEYVDYAASKGAVDTFTVGLANEVADEGIRVNAVRPRSSMSREEGRPFNSRLKGLSGG